VSRSCLDLASKTVFVTSTTYDGGTIGSIANANALCQARAIVGGLGGTYRAFISDDTTDAATNLNHATVPYALVDGTVVANNWADLIDGSLIHAIDLDESGTPAVTGASGCDPGADVYTGSFASGTRASGNTCASWSSSSAGNLALIGDTAFTDSLWAFDCGLSCDQLAALYCFEQ
jgi:hypothetical protein